MSRQTLTHPKLKSIFVEPFTFTDLLTLDKNEEQPVKGVDEGGDGDEDSDDKDDPSEEDAGDAVEKLC